MAAERLQKGRKKAAERPQKGCKMAAKRQLIPGYLPGDYYYPDDPSTIGKPPVRKIRPPIPDGKENERPGKYMGGFNLNRRPGYFQGTWISEPFNDRTQNYNSHVNRHGTHHNLDRPLPQALNPQIRNPQATPPMPPPNWHGMNPQAGSHGWNQNSHFGNTNRGPPTPNNQARPALGQINQGGGGWNQPFRGK
ncbi:unnamed protein product [Caenorhabditis auriculariae]|uniref:Uncharacterized protein n=1 Tax=Caenorhabditis auriculariae TaxID=2777116 RepID=A0A8S1H2A4_9PELO|nr:unnamed protein product [Caenorhabditis auriculariae]